jgi:beta-N-acetylhexosaminidase
VKSLVKGAAPVVLVSLGNPYLLRDFAGVSSYLATFSPVPASEISAVKGLFGEIAIRGRLPVSIPGVASVGHGLTVPKTASP